MMNASVIGTQSYVGYTSEISYYNIFFESFQV